MASKSRKTSPEPHRRSLWRPLLWVVLAGVWTLIVAALASYDPADWPGVRVAPHNVQPHNWVGQFGATVAHELYYMLGPGVWVSMAGMMVLLMISASGKRVDQLVLRTVGLILMGIGISTVAADGFGAGLVAYFIRNELHARFSTFGSYLIVGMGFWVGALLAVDQLVLALPRLIQETLGRLRKVRVPRPTLVGKLPALAWGRFGSGGAAVTPSPARGRTREVIEEEEEEAEAMTATATGRRKELVVEEEEDDAPAGDAPGVYTQSKKEFSPDELRAKIKQLPINFAARAVSKAPAAKPREVDLSGYRFPGLEILMEPQSNFNEEMERYVREQAVQLESALQQYHIEGEVVGIDSGPVITLFELRLAPGTKVAQLSAIDSDLARALKSHNIRIVPNTAGKDTVGIEVPNLKKEMVRLKELMTSAPEAAHTMTLPMYLGKDASGNPLVQDLASMPHMLIAGTTGSGKSVCMNSIIMSFLFTKRPDELKLALVDPKMVELSMFKDIPHLMCPVITEMSKAAAILEWAVNKMDERYELLAEAGVRDISSYNQLNWEELKERLNPASEAEEARIPKKLPYMVFVIDELADLIITTKEVESYIVRIAQKARAVGIHLILATQRPQANVVTGLIKSNMPCRVSFKVSSGMDSRIVLDQKGAELLLGQGDMLFLSPRTSKLKRAQGTLVDDLEVRRAVRFLKEQAQQNFEPQLVQIRTAEFNEGSGERDPMFDEAVRVVLESKRGSVSLLQRRLNVGYGRAAKLIEEMAGAGILGEYKGGQARDVTMTIEEYEALLAQAQADAADGMVGMEESTDESETEVPDEFEDEYRG